MSLVWTEPAPTADLQVEGNGTIYLLRPLTATGERRLEAHVHYEPYQRVGRTVAVEHRFVEAIVKGARADGLRVQ